MSPDRVLMAFTAVAYCSCLRAHVFSPQGHNKSTIVRLRANNRPNKGLLKNQVSPETEPHLPDVFWERLHMY